MATTKINQAIENLKSGIALAEIARTSTDKTLAKKTTKEAMSLINSASKAFMEDPDNWCPTPPIPWPWPWLRQNFQRDIFGNELVNISKIEVINNLENLKSSATSIDVKTAITRLTN